MSLKEQAEEVYVTRIESSTPVLLLRRNEVLVTEASAAMLEIGGLRDLGLPRIRSSLLASKRYSPAAVD